MDPGLEAGTRLPEYLVRTGSADTAANVARGLESVGVSPDIAQTLGNVHVMWFGVVIVCLLVGYYGWIGKKRAPQKKGKGKKRKKK